MGAGQSTRQRPSSYRINQHATKQGNNPTGVLGIANIMKRLPSRVEY